MILYCILFSLGYAGIETVYRQINSGEVTTVGQTLITFIWTPVIIYHFSYFGTKGGIILFPINVWLCEIIFGNILYYLWDYRLWYYNDTFSYFNNTISILFFPYWLTLGICINITIYWFDYLLNYSLYFSIINKLQNSSK